MFAYKASFEFDWITLIDSLTVSPLFAAKKYYEELDINNVCVLNIKARYIFFDRQNRFNGGIDAFVYSLIRPVFGQETNSEFDWIHSFESLTVIWFSCSEKFYQELENDIGRAFEQSNGAAFVSKLFSGNSNFPSRD